MTPGESPHEPGAPARSARRPGRLDPRSRAGRLRAVHRLGPARSRRPARLRQPRTAFPTRAHPTGRSRGRGGRGHAGGARALAVEPRGACRADRSTDGLGRARDRHAAVVVRSRTRRRRARRRARRLRPRRACGGAAHGGPRRRRSRRAAAQLHPRTPSRGARARGCRARRRRTRTTHLRPRRQRARALERACARHPRGRSSHRNRGR